MKPLIHSISGHVILGGLLRDIGDEAIYRWLAEDGDNEDHPAPDEDRSDSGPAPVVARRTVLVVDDDDLVRAMIAASVEHSGYEVVEVAGGEEAVAFLARSEAEIVAVVSDIRMPGMDGLELARIVTRNWPRLAIVLVSGYPAGGRITDMPEAAVFVPKPFRLEQLLDGVKRALAHKSGN